MRFGSRASLLAVALAVTVTSVAQDLVSSFPEYLRQHKFSEKDLHAVERGEAVVKLLDAEHRSETQLLGVVKIQGAPEEFISRYRNIVQFEKGTGILQNGLFSERPQISDLGGLSLDPEDFKDIKDCKPGDCNIKLSGQAIEEFQQFDWKAEDSRPKAEQLARQMIVDFLEAYQEGGNAALATLHDKKKPVFVGKDFEEMIDSPDLPVYFPELYSFLNDYPAARLDGAEEIFYWSKVDFGLKPVIRLNHIVIYGPTNITAVKYAMASKMLYASHYFNTGIEMKFLVERPDSPGAYYLVSNNRSRSDGFTGFTGFFAGRTIRGRARTSLESYLVSVKRNAEQRGTNEAQDPESSNAHDRPGDNPKSTPFAGIPLGEQHSAEKAGEQAPDGVRRDRGAHDTSAVTSSAFDVRGYIDLRHDHAELLKGQSREP